MKNKAFTLVELIIVIAILAMIMLIGTVAYSGIQERMKVKVDVTTASQVGNALVVREIDVAKNKKIKAYPQLTVYDSVEGVQAYIEKGINPQSMEGGYYIATSVETDSGKKILIGITRNIEGTQSPEDPKDRIYKSNKEPGWAWCQEMEIEEFMKQYGNKLNGQVSGDENIGDDDNTGNESGGGNTGNGESGENGDTGNEGTEGDDDNETIEPDVIKYKITATAVGNGSITPSGEREVEEGASSSQYVITPDEGYQIKSVKIDGVENPSKPNKYTFTNVTSNHSIVVEFEQSPIATLILGIDDILTSTIEKPAGITVTVRRAGDFANWEVSDGLDPIPDSDEEVTFKMPTGSVRIIARTGK